MITKLVVLASVILLAGCGQDVVEVGAGQAMIENAAAAVVVLEGDSVEADEQVRSIMSLDDGVERPPPPENLRSTSVFTEGEPNGRLYVQLIFQTAATLQDRQEIADRVDALGLDAPIWLGPEDPWPFCAETPCDLVKDDGRFPN